MKKTIVITDADIDNWSRFGRKSKSECSEAMWDYKCKDCEYYRTCNSALGPNYIIIPWECLDDD